MNIYLFDNNEIICFELPAKKIGDFWLKDSEKKNVMNICALDGNWVLSSSKKTKIYDSFGNSENIILKKKNYYVIEKNNEKFLLYCDYCNDTTFKNYSVPEGYTLSIGSDSNCNICIPLSNFMPLHTKLNFQNGYWSVEVTQDAIVYLNNKRVKNNSFNCNNGDLLNIYGLKILLIYGSLFVNNPFDNIIVTGLELTNNVVDDELTDEEIEDKAYYEDEDYYLKSPRVRSSIEKFHMKIDSPPVKENMKSAPMWTTIAPMITMIASTSVTLTTALDEYADGKRTLEQIMPTLVISGCMIFTMLIWPNISKFIQKIQKKKKEKERQIKYKEYISKKDRELLEEYENQKRIIEDNVVSTDVCYDMIINKRRTLWSRRFDQDDFLTVRIGIGDELFDAEVSYAVEDFVMESDELKVMVDKLIASYKYIKDVPVGYSFTQNTLTCINGLYPKYFTFTNNLILQMIAFHSYDDLKFVIFTNKKNRHRWECLSDSPYCFSNDKTIRFFATNNEEMQEVSNYLEQIFSSRQLAKDANIDKINQGHYMVIVDDIDEARKISLITKMLEEHENLGFSLLILEEKLSKVPSEVTNCLVIGDKSSIIWDMASNTQRHFIEEINPNYNMKACIKILSNLPLYMETASKQLPSSITFLETFGVGKVEQLNVLNRWKDNNPVKTIRAQIGTDVNGEPFMLDLHEKAHGPHGLVAGMTGSGKSEFIITYVLSMAVNYSPEEVQFVLIDYKGGGLASAFVDSETGKKIPHIAGTITNLDKSEIHRALASINSELRRRQEVFNDVKMKTGEGTVDIYKYQRMYRDGMLDEPMSHLVIVCDEFAELKSQQPEFMNDLVSAARIGRSLGVHLILATQKPSGVVDAQIWSNAKFKICLKVQDKQDSNEMIRNDLAAELKQVGRFYLLVGYSEFFSMGQSAWAGAPYSPRDEFKKTVDKNLYLIDNVGGINRTIKNDREKKNMVSQGEELTNIVKYLIDVGEQSNSLKLKQLWLDKIPALIYVDELKKKYNYKKQEYVINPILGEYDSPTNQIQDLLTVNFNQLGNTMVYGMSESGKDELLQTMVYSMIDTYSTDELNLYLIDFGAETLINFIDAPQVGDVVLSSDDEKLFNLIKQLFLELTKRKKLFTAYGGNYSDYIKHSGQTLPNIVVCINSINIINELYPEILEKYIPVIREGSKFGIHFLITSEAPGSVKSKIAQSCKNVITLQLNNESMYREVFGRTNGITPSQILGRGLVKLGEVCEFQTATVAKDEQFYNFIKPFIEKLETRGYSKAQRIYIMPEKVEFEPMKSKYTGIDSVPLGIIKEDLNVAVYDFGKKVVNIISSNEFENLEKFINNIMYVLSKNSGLFNVTIIDANNFFDEFKYDMQCVNENYDKFIDSIEKANETIQGLLEKNNFNYKKISFISNSMIFIIGFEKFYNKLDDDHKKKLQKILLDNSEFPKINFVLVDVPSGFKKFEYEDWYKKSFDNSNGIWVGPGLGQQFLIKTVSASNAISSVSLEYGVIIKNGTARAFKLINEFK